MAHPPPTLASRKKLKPIAQKRISEILIRNPKSEEPPIPITQEAPLLYSIATSDVSTSDFDNAESYLRRVASRLQRSTNTLPCELPPSHWNPFYQRHHVDSVGIQQLPIDIDLHRSARAKHSRNIPFAPGFSPTRRVWARPCSAVPDALCGPPPIRNKSPDRVMRLPCSECTAAIVYPHCSGPECSVSPCQFSQTPGPP